MKLLPVLSLSVVLLGGCTVMSPGPRAYGDPPVAVIPPPAQVEYVTVAPPPPRYELVGPAPAAGLIWIDGYWGWRNTRHVWIPGRWEARRHDHYWVPPRWEQRGPHWSLRGGYWRQR